jgi:iron complex transport system substrate-binding protein
MPFFSKYSNKGGLSELILINLLSINGVYLKHCVAHLGTAISFVITGQGLRTFFVKVLYTKTWLDNPSIARRSVKKLEKKYIIAIALIAIIAISSIGVFMYYQGQIASNTGTPLVTVTDDTGYVLNMTAYPERIVSLAPSNTQALFAVGAGDKVVGVTDFDHYPYNFTAWIEAGNMSSIGNYYQPAVEPIVALNPDLILASLGSIDAADQLRTLGYNVLTLNPIDLDGVMNNLIIVGKVTNHEAEAASVVSDMQARIDAVVNGVKQATTRPRVYHEIWSDPYMSVGKGTFVDNAIKLAGGQSIFENATDDYPVISSEAVIEQNPDIIVFPTQMGVESFWGDFETVKNRPGWSSINAVKNNEMYAVNGDIIDEPGPRQVDALEILAKIIHPEIFGTYTGAS